MSLQLLQKLEIKLVQKITSSLNLIENEVEEQSLNFDLTSRSL